ncbi:glycosyltransferase [Sabulilitoribacter arenilitoris]|uniref:Glycosyltransferase n=1 Tax=Wocania arenilitoris TaxID=2044858 RepID=A0AAE3EPV1_9FLAO|nr:glycosyltransferase [Wocania arenilitoris]MCF7568961.1 glycosyltransferase [Wocania arenilitoris]
MKILLVSMNSIHFQRWTNQLKNSEHEVYWFDIRDGGYSEKLSWVNQIVGWKQKFPNLKGRSFVKKKLPWLYRKISFLLENNTEKKFEAKLKEIEPDLVHSFVLYIACTPIYNVMKKYDSLKWIYSSWGSDLYYFQNQTKYLKEIKKVLPRVNYLFTDCKRDVELAKKYGFTGDVLGVFPGGGGYPLQDYQQYILPVSVRTLILVKGYQGRSGRAIPILKALKLLSSQLTNFKIVVFAADNDVKQFIIDNNLEKRLNLYVYSKKQFLPHLEIIKLMGQALIYIGNSNSDGIPNTLLEAIVMGAFPIQSNPGGATGEVIKHRENGLLIEDCNNYRYIKKNILTVLNDSKLTINAFRINQEKIKPNYSRQIIAEKVLLKYNSVTN